jgi:hypothetical protein
MRRKGAFCVAAGLALGLGAVIGGSALPAHAASGVYVALGDSYTSAPLISSEASGTNALCLQSTANYPHLTASALGLSLTDVSCAGAKVSDFSSSQYSGVAPQYNALSSSDTVVSVGIGGNDNSTFITALADCVSLGLLDPLNIGAPCKAAEGSKFANNISSDAANVGAALATIHSKAPNARVFVVGYPDIMPQSGNCYSSITVTTGDVAYLNGVEQDLNSMLKSEAAANGATYVDTYDPGIGHDVCKSSSVRWVEPIIPSNPGISVHPNANGEAAMASLLESAIG